MKKSHCLLSYTHDEHFFLPIFLRYYANLFPPEDIYIIENNSSDDLVYDLQKKYLFNRIIHNTQYQNDFVSLDAKLTETMKILLENYKGIYLAESDEILYHFDNFKSATDFYLKLPVPAVRCLGFEPIHDFKNMEPAINPNKPLLEQRKLGWDNHYFRKTVFIKQPISYWENMHNFDETFNLIDSKLLLVHLKMIDYDILWERNKNSLEKGNFHPQTLESCKGWQNRIKNKKDFDNFFTLNLQKCDPIPKKYQNII